MARALFRGLPFLSLALALWIVVPAPLPGLWMVALGASEYALWLGAAALLGFLAGRGRALTFAAALGTLALALYPQLSTHALASPLSLPAYLGVGAPRAAERRTVRYATVDGQPLSLDVYRPAEAGAPRAAVLVVHGGFWVAGERSDLPAWDDWLADLGYVVLDLSYRLFPQPNWRTATGDVKCAVGWARAHASELNLDPTRLALLGRSAGGHLALLAAYSAGDPELPPSCPVEDSPVSAVISIYGPTDLAWGYDHPANRLAYDTRPKLAAFLGGDPRAAAAAYAAASPITHVRAGLAPTLLVHGGRDQLVSDDQPRRLAARLTEAGAPPETLSLPYAQHGFDLHFGGWASQATRPVLQRFLQTHLAR